MTEEQLIQIKEYLNTLFHKLQDIEGDIRKLSYTNTYLSNFETSLNALVKIGKENNELLKRLIKN